MKISRKMLITLAVMSAVVGGCGVAVIDGNSARAADSTQLVKVVVPSQDIAIEITAPADGSSTNSASVEANFTASGVGHITLTDQDGNVLWEGDQTDDAAQNYTVTVNLPGGAGNYTLTAKIASKSDPTKSVSDAVNITYEVVGPVVPPIIPPIGDSSNSNPSAPNTGFSVRIGDFAIPVNYLVSYAIYLAVIFGGGIWFFVARRRKHESRENSLKNMKK